MHRSIQSFFFGSVRMNRLRVRRLNAIALVFLKLGTCPSSFTTRTKDFGADLDIAEFFQLSANGFHAASKCAAFSKRVYDFRNTSGTSPMGPLRCFATRR